MIIGLAQNSIRKYLLRRSLKGQRTGTLRDLSLWGLTLNGNGRMAMGETDLHELVRQYGSPLLVVNQQRLQTEAAAIQNAIGTTRPGGRVLYSYKTNCIPGILAEIHKTGIGAEVISPYELWLADRLGVPGEQIVYNGVNKTDESLEQAVDLGILAINVDNLPEIERIAAVARRRKRKVRVGVRLGFLEKSQFGLEIGSGEAMEAVRQIARLPELEMTCVHFCVTSNARTAATHCRNAEKALEFVKGVKDETGITVPYLDVGGGIGVPTSRNMTGTEYGLYRLFGCLPAPPDPADYEDIQSFVAQIDRAITQKSRHLNLEPPNLILEPGRFVTSRAEVLLSTVLALKKKGSGTTFAITDAGRLSVTFPCDFEYHQVMLVDQRERPRTGVYHIMGRICTSADWMAKNRLMPELKEGDVLATMDAGAYFSSYSTNFAFPRPAILMVTASGCEILRPEEPFEHLTRLDSCLAREYAGGIPTVSVLQDADEPRNADVDAAQNI